MIDALALTASPARLAAEGRIRAAVDEHYDVVWRFLRRMGVPEGAVEDAAQQVLLVFAKRIDRIEAGAERSFSWALRVAADFRKSHARRREVGDDAVSEVASEALDPDAALDEQRARRLLDRELHAMPEALRAVLVMCDVEEMTMAEVAVTLGIRAGTVASRLRRARARFQERIEAVRTSSAKRRLLIFHE